MGMGWDEDEGWGEMGVGTGREDGRKVGQGRIREAGSGEPGPPWGSARQPVGLRTVPVRHSDG